MALRLYNTLSRSLETFEPLRPRKAGVYACGPTVYRAPHIGNFRAFVFNDILHRYLEWKGFAVTFVMNLTDVDDKIIDAARAQGVTIESITGPQVDAFFEDLRTLGIRAADHYPRATEHIDQMVDLVERLVERKHAYVKDGSVYFDISSFPSYGRLARIDLETTRAGAGLATRDAAVDADEYGKDDARDFALWKATKDGDQETAACWPAPWGHGRPGWHLECSTMSMASLGETFDIHTGGEDLIFPHHEDEIAQSEGATGKPFVRYWLHVTHLKVGGEKMSKSKGNDYRIAQLLERGYSPAAIRYQFLVAHYRKELNFTFEGLSDAEAAIQRLLDVHTRLENAVTAEDVEPTALSDMAERVLDDFEEAMDDDLNTPNALGVLFPFVREVNAALDRARTVRPEEVADAQIVLESIDRVLGIVELARARAADVDEDLVKRVEALLQERQEARARRDFQRADAIRVELLAEGIIVEDTAQGPRWKRA